MVTVTARRRSPTNQRDWLWAAIGFVVICGFTYLFTRLSLDNVPGITRRRNGDCCNTEFVNNGWWMAMGGLIVPIWWVTRCQVWAAIPAVAVPTYASFYIASTTIDRYVESGWGDGLESLAYVGSIGHGLLFSIAAAIGFFSWRRRHPREKGKGSVKPD